MSTYAVTRWTGRIRPRLLLGSQAANPKPGIRRSQPPRAAALPLQRQSFSALPARQSSNTQNPQTGGPQAQKSSRKRGMWRQWVLFNIVGVSAAVITAFTLKSARSSKDSERSAVINKTSFSPFTITSKEQISPTAFVLSVRPGAKTDDGSSSNSSAECPSLREAWAHGLWSVEIKQPQLQIARHYTPLPPPVSAPADSRSENAELRFLIREVDGGEMSTYLGKQRVGDCVWMRGPHLGFDVSRRLGAARHVVFLAGGTGIAPALQVTRKLLDDGSTAEGGSESGGEGEREKPTVSILWANRLSADALGRQPQQHRTPVTAKNRFSGWWWSSNVPSSPVETASTARSAKETPETSLAQQIHALRQAHPDRFSITYFIDEERTFIQPANIRAALSPTPTSPSSTKAPAPAKAPAPTTSQTPQNPQPLLLPPAASCPWHSQPALEQLPDDRDAGRRASDCACVQGTVPTASAFPAAGSNLVLVSGPDGFVAALAGPRRWFGGAEMQGRVGGMLGRVLGERGKMGERDGVGWLVLKL
ncbi:hypothetical protein GGR54DRAFT_641984 [Hypoxylon sp. NC1633]|nr:hypothetical protein GGR54DRAFT_641984 [Hypoxylon sp. NC1633]